MAVGTKHAARLLMRAHLVHVKHHAELADNQVEAFIVEWQILSVGSLEGHTFGAEVLRREFQHHGVQVSGYDLRLRHRPRGALA